MCVYMYIYIYIYLKDSLKLLENNKFTGGALFGKHKMSERKDPELSTFKPEFHQEK